jgi:hypothetical protein
MIIMIIATALPELPPITRVCEADATPELLSLQAGFSLVLLLSLALWSGIAAIVIALLP